LRLFADKKKKIMASLPTNWTMLLNPSVYPSRSR
jgi:hypothetical protein